MVLGAIQPIQPTVATKRVQSQPLYTVDTPTNEQKQPSNPIVPIIIIAILALVFLNNNNQ